MGSSAERSCTIKKKASLLLQKGHAVCTATDGASGGNRTSVKQFVQLATENHTGIVAIWGPGGEGGGLSEFPSMSKGFPSQQKPRSATSLGSG